MKKYLYAIVVLIALAGHALALQAVATGSVTQENIKLSLKDGSAFVDIGSVLANYVGYKIVITDGASKTITGWIKAAGTAETYGAEQITNSDQEAAAMTPNGVVNGTYAQSNTTAHAGTYSGKYTCDTADAGTHWVVGPRVAFAGFTLRKMTAWVYVPSGQTITRLKWLNTATGTYDIDFANTQDAWITKTTYKMYHTGLDNGFVGIGNWDTLSADANVFYIDDYSIKEVLTPSATGVTIVTEYQGTTYNWAVDSGFALLGNYTYAIYPGSVATTISGASQTITGSVIDCQSAPGQLGLLVTGSSFVGQNLTIKNCPAGAIQIEGNNAQISTSTISH